MNITDHLPQIFLLLYGLKVGEVSPYSCLTKLVPPVEAKKGLFASKILLLLSGIRGSMWVTTDRCLDGKCLHVVMTLHSFADCVF